MRRIDLIVVHCTGTTWNTPISAIRQGWAAQGWKRPGYHYVVDWEGSTQRLAEDAEITNGAKGHNAHSIHLAYIGGIDAQGRYAKPVTVEQYAELRRMLVLLQQRYPQAKVCGHRDLSPDLDGDGCVEPHEWAKQCPCFEVRDQFEHSKLSFL